MLPSYPTYESLIASETLTKAVATIARLKGLTLKEACDATGICWNLDIRNKGVGGLIGELLLGLKNNGRPAPDMSDIGVEVKYLPVYTDKNIPKEPTQITMIDYHELILETWES